MATRKTRVRKTRKTNRPLTVYQKFVKSNWDKGKTPISNFKDIGAKWRSLGHGRSSCAGAKKKEVESSSCEMPRCQSIT